MNNWFIVAAPNLTPAQNDAVLAHLRDPVRFGFWHWIHNLWIVQASASTTPNAIALRDELVKVVPGVPILVLAIVPKDGDWAGWGPNQWTEWLTKFWKPS